MNGLGTGSNERRFARGVSRVANAMEEGMKHVLIVAGALAFASAASAQTTTTTTTTTGDSFYVVQDASTKKCTVSISKPSGTTTTIVGGDGTVYKTRTEAEEAMKKVTVCTQ
jgi:hypothetical protein